MVDLLVKDLDKEMTEAKTSEKDAPAGGPDDHADGAVTDEFCMMKGRGNDPEQLSLRRRMRMALMSCTRLTEIPQSPWKDVIGHVVEHRV